MTDLERAVADSLRITEEAANAMLPTIQRNIGAAKAELVRAGCSDEQVEESGLLVEDAIITFCMIRMGDENMRDKYQEAFEYQQDNLRKSKS